MTGQQYRVIADRDMGDDPQWSDIETGDRYLVQSTGKPRDWGDIVRIERPVPTTGEPDCRSIARDLALAEAAAIARDVRRRELDLHQCSFDEMPEANRTFVHGADRAAEYIEAARQHPAPHPPTREQIAEAIHGGLADRGFDFEDEDTARLTTRVLALIQNGADR